MELPGTACVPFRCVAFTTPVDKTEPSPDSVIPCERSESRNLPEWQILPYVGTFCHVVDSFTPLALKA